MRRLALALMLICWPSLAWAQPIQFVSTQGTISSKWCIQAPGGACLVNNAGAIETRDATLASFAILRGATPVGTNDLTSKAYSDGHVIGLPLVAPGGGTLVLTSTSGVLSWAGGGSGITQLTGDGTAGPGTGSQVLTLATVNGSVGTFGTSSSIPSFTVNGKGLITGVGSNTVAAPLASATGILGAPNGGSGVASPAAHDVLISEGAAAFTPIALGNTQILVGQTGADPAAETLSGDAMLSAAGGLTLSTVNANVGSFGTASSVPTLTLNGKGLVTAASNTPISISNTNLTAGTYSNITGTGTLTAGATGAGFTLNFGTSTLSGTVPNANQAAQTLAGDVTGNTAASVVSAISGTSPIAVTPNSLQWIQAASAPQFSQSQQANGSNPVSFTIAPQAPGAGAASTATGTPGSAIVNVAAPVSTGTEAGLTVNRNGTFVGGIHAVPGASSFAALYLSSSSLTAMQTSGATMSVGQDSTAVSLVPSNLSFLFAQGGGGSRGVQLGYNAITTTFGGGDNIVGISDTLTNPTAAASAGGVAIYSNAHVLETNGAGYQISKLAQSPSITHNAQTTDVAATTMTVHAQNAWASASTNTTGASLILQAGSGTTALAGGSTQMIAGDAVTGVIVQPKSIAGSAGTTPDETITHTGTGARNTQVGKFDSFAGYNRLTGVSASMSAVSKNTLASGTNGLLTCHCLARVVTAGTGPAVGDMFQQDSITAVRNVGGVLSQVGTTTVVDSHNSATFDITASGVGWNSSSSIGCSMLLVPVGGLTMGTVDATVWGELVLN